VRRLAAIVALTALAGGAVRAHHSYGDVLRDQTVTLTGNVKSVLFANPHVMVTIEADDTRRYTVEWMAAGQLERSGVSRSELKPGDRIVVIGSPARDPEERRVTLIKEISRVGDGWSWKRGW
jgi:hypothetical protein